MNTTRTVRRSPTRTLRRKARGVGLIEVMIAMLILAFGFLALGQLQIASTRSAAEARARTASVSLATDKLEEMRSFLARTGDADGDGTPDLVIDIDGDGIADEPGAAFDSIAAGSDTPTEVGTGTRGFQFARSWTSTPCRIGRDAAVTCGGMVTADNASFLRVSVRVTWTSADAPEVTQEVLVEDLISATSPLDAAVAISNPSSTRERPKVYIQPARIQSTIPIALGNGLDSAASDPQPTIIRDNIVRTQFEVLTYSTDNEGLLAERAFDYTVVGCDCQLRGVVAGAKSFEPTIWNGLTFSRPRELTNGVEHPSANVSGTVSRVSASAVLRNNDPPIIKELCTSCCRDHHDSNVSATPKLDPTRPTTEYLSNGNHKHYLPVLQSGSYTFTEASAPGAPYYETCRFIRRDGIYRLTLDAHLADLAVFRESDLDDAAEREAYSNYARQFIDSYVNRAAAAASEYPNFSSATRDLIYADAKAGLPPAFTNVLDPASNFPLPSPGLQLVSRGIYVDFMTTEVLDAVRCKINNTPDTPACLPYRDSEKLELVPLFAVGMTRLNNWRPQNPTVAIMPLRVRTDPFSRGWAEPVRNGATLLISESPISNIGLTNPVPGSAIERSLSIIDQLPVEVGLAGPPVDPPRSVTFRIDRDRNTLLDTSGDVLLSGSGGACTQQGQQAGVTTWRCNLNSNGTGNVFFASYTGTECVERQGGTCILTAPVRNQLCFAPQPPSVTANVASNAYASTTTVSFNGSQPADAVYSVDVKLATATCPGSDAFPGVVSTSPANGATDVPLLSSLRVDFSEAVNTTAGAVTLKCNGGPDLITGGTVATNVSSLYPTYASPLPVGATCIMTVVAANVTDVDTIDPPDQMGSNYVASFVVISLSTDLAPTVTSTTPGNVSGVLVSQPLRVEFSEPINAYAGSVTLSCNGGANLITGGTTGSGVSALTPTYAGNLPAGQTCTMTVLASLIRDADTIDPPDNMVLDYTVVFNVANMPADTRPTVTVTIPTQGSTGFTKNSPIQVSFSEPVDTTTGSVTLTCGGAANRITGGTVGTNITTLNLTQANSNVAGGQACTLTVIASKVTDRDGTPETMAANHVVTFTSG
jgi:type II secretory pathway pseudopilin PulG